MLADEWFMMVNEGFHGWLSMDRTSTRKHQHVGVFPHHCIVESWEVTPQSLGNTRVAHWLFVIPSYSLITAIISSHSPIPTVKQCSDNQFAPCIAKKFVAFGRTLRFSRVSKRSRFEQGISTPPFDLIQRCGALDFLVEIQSSHLASPNYLLLGAGFDALQIRKFHYENTPSPSPSSSSFTVHPDHHSSWS